MQHCKRDNRHEQASASRPQEGRTARRQRQGQRPPGKPRQRTGGYAPRSVGGAKRRRKKTVEMELFLFPYLPRAACSERRDATQTSRKHETGCSSYRLLGALCLFLIPQASAQGPGAHSMVTPDQLQWKDVPALGAGVQLALIEGPMNEAVPFMVRDQVPSRGQGPCSLASSD